MRRGYANGFKPRTVNSRLGQLQLEIPQIRDIEFYPAVLERGKQSERALKLAVGEMYVQGVSIRKVTKITQDHCGPDISSTQVIRAAELLDQKLHAWRELPLGTVPHLILDAGYEKARHCGSVRDYAVLIAIGVLEDGKRSVLGVSVSLPEAEVHWCTFMKSLIDRGLHRVQQNAAHYVPMISIRTEVAVALRNVFELPPHQRRLRTTHMLERLNQEINRRARVAALFPMRSHSATGQRHSQ